MPKDAGGLPYPEGGDHGGADDEFAAVVFDEAFVRAAEVHEPTAEERILSAVEARLERDAGAGANRPGGAGEAGEPEDVEGDAADEAVPEELRVVPDTRYRVGHWYGGGPTGYPYWSQGRQSHWQRAVAWVLALVMGLGVVLLAAAAVYRGVSGGASQATVPTRAPESTSSSSPSTHSTPSAPVSTAH